MKKKKIIKISAVSAALAICVAAVALGIHFGYAKTTDQTTKYTVETGDNPLRVAVISDLQMPDSDSKTSHQYESFEKTLTMLKNKGMDALIIAGDFTDLATEQAYGTYKEIYDRVMGNSEKPISLFIMGNHDYWLSDFVKSWEIPTPAKMQKRFTEFTGEYPYSHKIINGYHFICRSSSDGSYDKSYSDKKWIISELDKAVAADPTKPIFVITHLNPSDTAYGSDEWGNDDIADILKDYKQVISISGHSHYSIIDEHSIWQGDYTAFTTQSLDYIELESGKFNGSIPKDAYGNSLADKIPACLYMEIESDKVTISRLESSTGKELKEPWVISAPFGSEESLSAYTDARSGINKAPTLSEDLEAAVSEITDNNGNTQKALSFRAGTDDDFVHSYKLKFLDSEKNAIEFDEVDYSGNLIRYDENGKKSSENGSTKKIDELLYFSDFVLGLENMEKTALLRLPATMPDNAEYIAITAIDSWGAESNTVLYKLG